MSENIDIGSKLVCVNDDFPAWARATYSSLPVKDSIYTIRKLDKGLDAKELVKHGSDKDTFKGSDPLKFTGFATIMVLLEEIHNPIHMDTKKEMGFKLERFRPLLDTTNTAKASAKAKAPKSPTKAPAKPRKQKERVLEPIAA